MKILSVVIGFLGNDAASWRVWNIARLLQSRGHEVHLVQYLRNTDLKRLKDNKLDLTGISSSAVPIFLPTVQITHLRELSKDNYDMVYGNRLWGAFSSMLGRLLKGVPLIVDMHGVIEEFLFKFLQKPNFLSLWNYILYKPVEFADRRFSTKITCVSRKMIEYLHTRKRVPLGKMHYITNGVDLNFYKPVDNSYSQTLRKQLGLENKLVFGYVGAMQQWQGIDNFVRAARLIDDTNLAFLMVGGEKELCDRNISFVPRVSREQVPNYYSLCDVLVLPRPHHLVTEVAAPTKFAEYTAMGKPVLVTNVGDAGESTKKYNCGVVAEDNSVEKLTEGILEFRSKGKDELKVMGENSRKLAEAEFDWNKIADNLVNMIEGIGKRK